MHSLRSHTGKLSGVFCHVHAAAKNGFDLFYPGRGDPHPEEKYVI